MWKTITLAVDYDEPIQFNISRGIIVHRQIKMLLFLCMFVSITANSAVQKKSSIDNSKIIKELTGYTQQEFDYKEQSDRAYAILANGEKAFKNKNYAAALKEYNIVVTKFKNIRLAVRSAYLAKAKLFDEMGLSDLASQNAIYAKESSLNNIAK